MHAVLNEASTIEMCFAFLKPYILETLCGKPSFPFYSFFA